MPRVLYEHKDGKHIAYYYNQENKEVVLYRGDKIEIAHATKVFLNHHITHNPSNNLDAFLQEFLVGRS